MKKVTAASGDYLAYFHPLTIVSNIFMRNGIYSLMFIGRIYNNQLISNSSSLKSNLKINQKQINEFLFDQL